MANVPMDQNELAVEGGGVVPMEREATIRLGACKVDITPSHPVPLAGFALRSGMGPFDGISHPLFARIFVFSAGEGAEAVLISADLLWWGSDRVPGLKRRIRQCCGVDESAILLHGTHTHSGPQTSERFTSFLGAPDPDYLERMEDRVLEGIRRAIDTMEPVRADQVAGESPLGINRRGARKSPPVAGPTDHELRVVRFRRSDGTAKALLVHYACHPVITQENKISSEFTGVAMNAVEQAIGDDVVAGFLQGTCGDINPGDGKAGIRGNDELVVRVGRAFADDIVRALSNPSKSLEPCGLRWVTRTVDLPLNALPDRESLLQGASLQGVEGEWSRIQLARYERLVPTIPLELTLFTVAEGLSFLAFNAEVVVDYGLYVKRLSGGSVLPIGYTNGMFGYIPTALQLREGGYEPIESTIYFAMPSPFHPAVETVVRKAVAEMLRR